MPEFRTYTPLIKSITIILWLFICFNFVICYLWHHRELDWKRWSRWSVQRLLTRWSGYSCKEANEEWKGCCRQSWWFLDGAWDHSTHKPPKCDAPCWFWGWLWPILCPTACSTWQSFFFAFWCGAESILASLFMSSFSYYSTSYWHG